MTADELMQRFEKLDDAAQIALLAEAAAMALHDPDLIRIETIFKQAG